MPAGQSTRNPPGDFQVNHMTVERSEPPGDFEILEVNHMQSFQRIRCPNAWCNREFRSIHTITEHLNSPEESLWCEDLRQEQSHLCLPRALQGNTTADTWTAQYHALSGETHQEQSHLCLPPALRQLQGNTVADTRTAQYHTLSGETYGKSKNLLQQMEDDPNHKHCIRNHYYPFTGAAKWTLAKFLAETLTQTQINQFLKLCWFCENAKPSFSSAKQLLGWIDILPGASAWQTVQFEIQGYPTMSPIQLIWCDGLETVRSIVSNPVFANNITFDPIKIQRNNACEYGEWFTSQEAFRIQDQLPVGATIMPIIAASNKTPVICHTRGLEMHLLFITIGNIDSDIRMKATSHAWQCVAFIPTPKFEAHPDYQTILQARLWHKCVDLVFANLKDAALHGDFMVDLFGDIRHCFTPLVAWTTDLPEQLMIACISKNASPVTEASIKQFGDGKRYASRTGEKTLEHIFDTARDVDPWNLDCFQKYAKALLLLGVHLPFWRHDYLFSNPAVFLVPEVLHTLHKLFFNHVLAWCKEILGKDELDFRFKSAHKRISMRQFSGGVLHVQQMTGRKHCDIQWKIVPILAGAAPPDFVAAIRSIVDFIYQAQSPVHTDTTITSMQATLDEFHARKNAIIEAGARKGKSGVKTDFYIPKLELLQSFADAIRNSGAIIQYTADVSERLLITHCKQPFLRTNKQAKDFSEQVVRILDREDKMHKFNLFTLLTERGQSLINDVVAEEYDEVASSDPTATWISRVLPDEEMWFKAPCPVRNHFTSGLLSDNQETALHVTVAPDSKQLSLENLSQLTRLPDIEQAIVNYVASQTSKVAACMSYFKSIDVWHKFRVQLCSNFQSSIILPSQVVQAHPPGGLFPYGNCDIVLLDSSRQSQRHLRFNFLLTPMLYVQYFKVCHAPDEDPSTRMWMVERCLIQTERGPARLGEVVPLTCVSHAAELVAVYGKKADRGISSYTSQECYSHYYLNHYADKEVYNVLHGKINEDFYHTDLDTAPLDVMAS